jgi:hypothetical protein
VLHDVLFSPWATTQQHVMRYQRLQGGAAGGATKEASLQPQINRNTRWSHYGHFPAAFFYFTDIIETF